MWKRRICLSLIVLLVPVHAAALEIRGARSWQGEVDLPETVTVLPGGVLTIAPGTTVRPRSADSRIVVQGVIKAEGTAKQPITFAAPDRWLGIEFVEAESGSLFLHVRFEGAEAAISTVATPFTLRHGSFRRCATAVKLLRESHPVIEDCTFVDNDIAIDNEMKSKPVIRRNRFTGHRKTAIIASHNSSGTIEENLFEKNKQAIGLLQKYPDRLASNRFIDNEVGIFCNQTQNTPLIRDNLFEKNGVALVNFSFAYPAVENNRFLGNGTAIRNDQFGSPLVRKNLFRKNETAIYNNRKSNPKIEKNRLENNRLALFCDYSSYPQVKENNFLGNPEAVKLGIYQSADWEKRSGSKTIVEKTARERNSKNPLLPQAPTEFTDRVDVTGNWWGKDTPLLGRAGSEGNLPLFHDRHDLPTVSYEGFGPEKYRLDVILFSPWLEKEVADAGPEGGR